MSGKPAMLSPEWYAERSTYLGASEMAAALGLSPWGDPISVWEDKIGEGTPRDEKFRMKLGTLIEPIIGKLTSEALGARLVRMAGPIRHPRHPFLASNPDFRIVGSWHDFRIGRGLVQAKLHVDDPWGSPDDGEGLGLPLHYRLQGFGELLTTGFDYVIFGALDPRLGVTLYPLDRRMGDNEAAIDDLRADLVEWWHAYVVERRIPPASGQSGEALRRRYPKAETKVGKIASAEQAVILDDYVRLKDSQKAIEAEVDRAKNAVKQMIGTAAWIEGAGRRFNWSRFETTKVGWEQIAGAYRRKLIEIEGAFGNAESVDKLVADLDTIEGLYTTTEPSDRLTIGEVK